MWISYNREEGGMKDSNKKIDTLKSCSPVGMSLGLSLGLIWGIIFDNIPIGLLVGTCLSSCLGSYSGLIELGKEKNKTKDE